MRGHELREARKRLGLSQAELAERIGLSRDFIGLMERGRAPITARTRAAIAELRPPPPPDNELVTTDPMERIIERALRRAGLDFSTDFGGGNASGLDFKLANGVEIEVKRMYSPRSGDQLGRAENVILAQGADAIRFLAGLLVMAGQAAPEGEASPGQP